MRWPWQKEPDPVLRDTAALDALLEVPSTRASVLAFTMRLEVEHGEATPEALIDLALEQGLDRETAMLLVALAARLEGAQ